MGTYARALVRWRWAVLGIWIVLGAGAAIRAPATPELLNVRGGSDKLTEAALADQALKTRFSQSLSDFFALTLEGPAPFDSGRPKLVLDSLTRVLSRQSYIRSVVSWPVTHDSTFISADHRATFLILALAVTEADTVASLVTPVRTLIATTLRTFHDGEEYTAHLTGRSPLDLDVRRVSVEDSKVGEARLLPLTLVVLVLAFGALVSAALPLIIGFLAIAVSLTIIGLLTRVTPMSIFVLNMTSMIGLGVGIDYSLLVVTRFREELRRGARRREATMNTIKTAGVSVVTSGMTVVVGFAALLFTPMIETRSVGLGGLVVVAVAVVLSITLLPALLAIIGRDIDRPKWLAKRLAWYHSPRVWEKWARTLARHPVRAITLGGLAIAVLSTPLLLIRIGLPAHNWWPTATEAGQGLETLQRMGVAGYIQPVRVVVEMPEGGNAVSAVSLRGLRALSDSFHADPRVREVRSLVDINGRESILELSAFYSELDSARAEYGDFVDAYLSRDSRVALLDLIPSDSTSLTSTQDLVRHVRALVAHPPKQLAGATIRVGGYSASALDFQDDLMARFPLIVLLVLGATGLMLAIAFKSLLVPIKAIIMNTLSVSATFGLIVLVFQYGLGARLLGLAGATSAIFVVVPVLVFAVVFGLSMDYEVFLLSRIKEAFDRTGRNSEATMEGVAATASVITSAALIMIMVFGVFAFARVLVMQFLGFGLAVAVLLDATIIRMVLVPAIMQLAGRWNWWPGVRRVTASRPSLHAPPTPAPPPAS